MRDTPNSQVINYVCPILFIQSESYQPLLEKLYHLKFSFDILTLNGITTILEIMAGSDQVLDYIIKVPPPGMNFFYNLAYSHNNYLDWIKIYAFRLEHEDHLVMANEQKKHFSEKIN